MIDFLQNYFKQDFLCTKGLFLKNLLSISAKQIIFTDFYPIKTASQNHNLKTR